MDILEHIKEFKPLHDYFIGVDSDGTAFDSMGIKHTLAFIPMAIKVWGLEKIEKEFYEVAEFVNLYSNMRGINRFQGLFMTFEYIEKRQDIKFFRAKLPDYRELKLFVESGLALSNNSLEKYAEGKDNKFLVELMEWSIGGDKLFTSQADSIKPFDFINKALQKAISHSDLMIISSASTKGLLKDWGDGDILKYMALIAGQEAGTKSQQLKYATEGKYKASHVLMIGDAPGDYNAAISNNALFYPINPGHEVESWKKFYGEAFERFITGKYAGEYESILIKEFLEILPEEKTW